jgi:serine phosphatase RsbU (regulator of sigma subunit)/anti-sigma regulatory factor (Ser/Thr protein kinase)/anti-anti-sigma regulatory factor
VTQHVLARRAAAAQLAGAERRYAAARDVVLTLQRSLLPAVLPIVPRARVAAEYRVAEGELQAGGDWFDAIALRDGRLALVVGDVVGHGAEAAAAMARLSPVLHEALSTGVALDDALARLDGFASTRPTTRAATACVVVLDPGSGSLRWLSRGHPPPLVCGAGGATRFLEAGAGGPLGVDGPSGAAGEGTLAEDELLLLYSDGLIEERGRTLGETLAQLARYTATAVATRGRTAPQPVADRVCQLLLERFGRRGFTDDVTVLGVHRRPGTTPALSFDQPATSEAPGVARLRLRDWLRALGACADDCDALTLAVYEAAVNATHHAYRGRDDGRVRVHAALDVTGDVHVEVADDGAWRAAGSEPGRGGGRGLSIMRASVDELVVARSTEGTTVRLRRRIGHATVLGDGDAAVAAADDDGELRIERQAGDPPVLRLRGPVDAVTAGLLRHAVGAGAPAVLDLTGVPFLASAGVQVLHDLAGQGGVSLIAPPGSPARHVLELSALGHLLTEDAAA